MQGIETIIGRIQADAQQEVDAVLAAAKTEADSITARYKAQAEQAAADILEKGNRGKEEVHQRLISTAEMDAKKQELSTKQEVLDKAFALALDKLNKLPEEEYVNLLAQLAAKASRSGREQLIFSGTDRARYGVKVATRANELLQKAGKPAELTLSEQSRDFQGGLLVSDGDVEVNCTFETLVRLARSEAVGEVSAVLFA
jgi:V/A-type H+-transporting ATPase subunit E